MGKIIKVSFKASGVNAINSYVTYGIPSLFAFWGFAHSLSLKLNVDLKDERVLPIVHYYRNRAENGVFTLEKSASKYTGNGSSLIDMPRGDIECTILFKSSYENEFGDENLLEVSKIRTAINYMKFAGGVIHKDSLFVEVEDDTQKYEEKIYRNIKEGYLFKQHIQEFADETYMEDFIEKLAIKKGKKGWFIPLLLGFAPIEEPTKRDNVRFEKLHCFAEPLIGIVEVKIFKKYGDERTTLENSGWSLDTKDTLIVFKN